MHQCCRSSGLFARLKGPSPSPHPSSACIFASSTSSRRRIVSSGTAAGDRFSRGASSNMPRAITKIDEDASGDLPVPQRSYQVVVAATQGWGIGKDGKLPWKLPRELKFFKELTCGVPGPRKKMMNAVLMGRRTWESIPTQFRPLPGRLNVVLSRSVNAGAGSHRNVVWCASLSSALELLSAPPYHSSIETVFVIGGGEILREALNAELCDAIHITEIETDIECDTFMPAIDSYIFRPWYSSSPFVENGARYSFATYVRVRTSVAESQPLGSGVVDSNNSGAVLEKFEPESFFFLPEMILERHGEFSYLRLVREVLSSGTSKVDAADTGLMSKFGLQMRFNLRKSFPLLTTKKMCWQVIVDEFLTFISGSNAAKLSNVVNDIITGSDDPKIILSWDGIFSKELQPRPMVAQFYVSNGELSCKTYQEFADAALDLPHTIALCALLTCTVARLCGLRPGESVQEIGDAYVCDSHIGHVQEQLGRLPLPFPSLKIDAERKNIGSLTAADFRLIGYHNLA